MERQKVAVWTLGLGNIRDLIQEAMTIGVPVEDLNMAIFNNHGEMEFSARRQEFTTIFQNKTPISCWR